MTPDNRLIDRLAEAVLDGEAIDWPSAEATAGAAGAHVRHLKAVASVAKVHRLETWGHLRVLERIGRGTFGEVYRAWDTRLDREVALKLLPAAGVASDDSSSSIIHEGRLLARIHHPNVATIYGADEIDGFVGLWMEFVRGDSLEGLLRAGTTFTHEEVATIGTALGYALDAVHAAGVLHRDIKAQNVMRATQGGRVVLMDFGTGRDLTDRESDMTGTPLYLAPEVLAGELASVQSDIYSLGVLLFRLLTGGYPINGWTVDEVRQAHQDGPRPDVHSRRPHVPTRLANVINRALSAQPHARYETAEALSADLAQLREAPTGRRRRRAAAVAATCSLAGVVIWASGWTGQWSTTRRVTSSMIGVLGPTSDVLPAGERPVIAVRPFEAHGSAETRLIVDGLTYELVRRLAVLDGLDARSAMSSLASRDDGNSVQAFGRQLGANLVLAGLVRVGSDKTRIDVQLVRVSDDVTVWADAFESATNDMLAMQEEISLAIANKLRLRGLGQRRYQLDPALYELFLTARAYQAKRNIDNAAQAAALYERIIAADPSFAPALAGLASAVGAFWLATPSVEPLPPDPRMRPAATRAIALDPLLAEAHAAIGHLHARDHEWDHARVSFERAIELDPTLTHAHSELVLTTLLPLGRIADSLRVMTAARTADPMSLDVRRILALVQVESERYEEAIENSRWVLARDPQFPYAHLWLGRALVLSGRPEEGIPVLQDNWRYAGYAYGIVGRRAEASALAAAHPEDPAGQMMVYAGLGDRDRTFEALARASKIHWWRAATWMVRPELKFLRQDPRYRALRKQMGLPEELTIGPAGGASGG